MKKLKTITGLAASITACAMMFTVTSCSNSQKQEGLNDAQIAKVAVVANQIDIDYANVALKKSDNPAVKKFAKTMAKDHQDIIDQAVALVKKLGVTPEANDFGKALLDGASKTKAKFAKLDGADFDKAYIANEVAYHKAVIGAVKDSLIPSAKNKELKKLLTSVVPLLEHHLEMAEAAKKEINNAAKTPKLNDAQIASAAVVANKIDVEYGEIALKKTSNDKVKHFAQTMMKDHNGIIKTAVDLATKLGVTPDNNNPVTQSLLKGGKETKVKLNGLSGEEFDKAYIANEVAYHTAVINAVKNVLIPQTQNAELKQTLQSVVPLLDHHLMMAKKINAEVNGK